MLSFADRVVCYVSLFVMLCCFVLGVLFGVCACVVVCSMCPCVRCM